MTEWELIEYFIAFSEVQVYPFKKQQHTLDKTNSGYIIFKSATK